MDSQNAETPREDHDPEGGAPATGSGMNDDQLGNLIAAILTAGTLAASQRGILDARNIPGQFLQVRNELRAAGIIHRNRSLSRRNGAGGTAAVRRLREVCGEAG